MNEIKIAEFFGQIGFKVDETAIKSFVKSMDAMAGKVGNVEKGVKKAAAAQKKAMAEMQKDSNANFRTRQAVKRWEDKAALDKERNRRQFVAQAQKDSNDHFHTLKSIRRYEEKQEKQKLSAQRAITKAYLNDQKLKERAEIQALKARAREERAMAGQSAWSFGPTRQAMHNLRDRWFNNQSKIKTDTSFGPSRQDANRLRDRYETQMQKAEIAAYAEEARRNRTPVQRTTSTRRSDGRFGAIQSGLMGWGRGFLPGLGGAYAVSEISSQAMDMQGQKRSLGAVLGSQEAGEAGYANYKNMANELGFNYRENAPRYMGFLAGGMASGQSKDKMDDAYKGMMGYGLVMGWNKEKMARASTAITQMIGKQQVFSEELKGQ